MERQHPSREATAGGKARRGSRKESKPRDSDGRRKPSVSSSGTSDFQLHAAGPTQQRPHRQQPEERACLQMRKAQQKLLGKKTLEDFAQLKLLRRETPRTRSTSLHCNGKSAAAATTRAASVEPRRHDQHTRHPHFREDFVHAESRPLRSARGPRVTPPAPIGRKRPLSAKPALPTQTCYATATAADASAETVVAGRGLIVGQRVSVRQWEQSFCTPVVLAASSVDAATQVLASSQSLSRLTAMLGKKKASARRMGASASASALPDKSERGPKATATSKKLNIVVDMRRLELRDDAAGAKALPTLGCAPPSTESERSTARVQAWM